MIASLVKTYSNGNRKIKKHLEPKENKNNITGEKNTNWLLRYLIKTRVIKGFKNE